MTTKPLKLALAQLNVHVGAIEKNVDALISAAQQAKEDGADLLVGAELCITGYPPEDLLFRSGFTRRVEDELQRLIDSVSGIDLIIGYPKRENGKLYNVAGVIINGQLDAEYRKQKLPNYSVFDEKRYFIEGNEELVIDYQQHRLGITICEDIWHEGPVEAAAAAGASVIINLNASPYHTKKIPERFEIVANKAKKIALPIVYVNQVGGQDELVFDGASFCVSADGSLQQQSPSFEESIDYVEYLSEAGVSHLSAGKITELPEFLPMVYSALVCGVRDYVEKNGFKGVVLGLSGGIDSGLTVALAVDALGADRVNAIMMPFRYTSDMSKNDAEEQARRLGVNYESVSIEPMYDAFVKQLEPIFTGLPKDTTEENIQARCRGLLLMAYSNKTGNMVLTTGNKSEMAVGYATLYGDMVGGYSGIKDVPKTLVYQLAEYRNSLEKEDSPVIPKNVIERPPSAELAPDQKDSDSLPDYDILDPILEYYVEQDLSPTEIIAKGYAETDVSRVVHLVNRNEYKRRQSAPGVRITRKAFGRDRRYPITSGFKSK